MPFGIQGAPATFQRVMSELFDDLPFVIPYVDDLVVKSASVSEHAKHLKVVAEKLTHAGLFLKAEKCIIGHNYIEVFGHLVGNGTSRPHPARVEALRAKKAPQNLKQLRSFLGSFNYYLRYIPNYSHVALPLIRLTKSDVPFVWSKECETSFQALKEALLHSPIMTLPHPDRNQHVHSQHLKAPPHSIQPLSTRPPDSSSGDHFSVDYESSDPSDDDSSESVVHFTHADLVDMLMVRRNDLKRLLHLPGWTVDRSVDVDDPASLTGRVIELRRRRGRRIVKTRAVVVNHNNKTHDLVFENGTSGRVDLSTRRYLEVLAYTGPLSAMTVEDDS